MVTLCGYFSLADFLPTYRKSPPASYGKSVWEAEKCLYLCSVKRNKTLLDRVK